MALYNSLRGRQLSADFSQDRVYVCISRHITTCVGDDDLGAARMVFMKVGHTVAQNHSSQL